MNVLSSLLPLLLSAALPETPLEIRYPEATKAFHCTFDESWDKNFDEIPDGWTRQKGPGYPRYVSVAISDEPSVVGDRCLRIDLDGGAATAFSPPTMVGPLFSYVLEAYVKTEGLKYDRAYLSITLLDDERNRLETYTSEKVRQTAGWQKIRLGPIAPVDSNVRAAIIGLHVEPGRREDLTGSVLFDDIWLGRLPRMAMKTTSPNNFFTDPRLVEVTCTASGFLDANPRVRFQLEDVLGQELAHFESPLSTKQAAANAALTLDSFADQQVGSIGKATWKPPISDPGFYRIRVMMAGQKTAIHQRELTLVVVDPRRNPTGGEFGWTVPQGDQPLPLPLLNQLISHAGINCVKYPFWYDEAGGDEVVSRVIAFAERLSAGGIELVGLLNRPPKSLRSRYGRADSLSVADIFSPNPAVWYPSLETVMTRLATRVRRWQLGDDHDTSFVGYPNVAKKIGQIKHELDRIGQDVRVGIGWEWLHEFPEAADGKAPWQFLTLSTRPALTHLELARYLQGSADANVDRWVDIEPLSRQHYSLEVRATDLVRRMIAAKIEGADAIFCPDPFSTDHGLMNDDGTPGELFLAWRTAAMALGGARYLESIQLPGKSHNQIFGRVDDAVMIVWNERPTEEVLYLGEHVRQIDIWGRSTVPEQRGHKQVIKVGPLPSFIVGLNEAVTRWRQDFKFAETQIPSIFGRPHLNSFSITNHFTRGTSGVATLVMPEIWLVDPAEISFRMANREQLQQLFQIKLPDNASSGRHNVRVDFLVRGEREYNFSVYRKMDIGLGDIYIEVETRLTEDGRLEIEQHFINETDGPANFRCYLYAPKHRRQKADITAGPQSRDVQIYRLNDGKELLGKTLWLRAEEINGPRVLSYRFVGKE
ncbi:MAG: hypothetical protein V3R99_09520 [Thermoguttaceae bacterium]